MKKILIGLCCLTASLLTSIPGFSQYPGGGMGYGGGGYGGGRRMGGGNFSQGMTNSSRPSIPNIAGDLAQKETKWLKENLSLTKDQLKAVKSLNNEYASQQQDAIKDIVGASGKPGPDTRKQIQDMMIMLNEEKEDKLKTLITPEQWTLYQSKKADMQKEVGGWRPAAPKDMQAKPDSATSVKP